MQGLNNCKLKEYMSERKQALSDVLKKIRGNLEKKEGFSYGLDRIDFADVYTPGEVKSWIPSGINLLDYVLGGGLPVGRVCELFSESESEGKSTLALHFAAQCQARGGAILWFEQETALDKERARRMGVDTDSLVITCPHSVEDGFLVLQEWVRAVSNDKAFQGAPLLIVWDTIAAAPTRAEHGDNPFASGMTAKPRIISQALRPAVQYLYKANATLLLVNQSYTQINSKLPFPVYEQPGGKGIKFYSSLRFRVKRKGYLSEAKTVKSGEAGKNTKTGILVEVETVKNKLAPPFRSVRLALEGPTGLNNPLSFAHYYADTKQTDMVSGGGGGRYGLAGEVTTYWKDLEQAVSQNPDVLQKWQVRASELFPLPPDRQVNPNTGWVEMVEGTQQFLSFGDGERAMTDEEIELAAERVRAAKKEGNSE